MPTHSPSTFIITCQLSAALLFCAEYLNRFVPRIRSNYDPPLIDKVSRVAFIKNIFVDIVAIVVFTMASSSEDKKCVAIADLPPLPSAPREYAVTGVLLGAFLCGLGHLVPFFLVFFISFASDSGLAWWSFCFFGSAICQSYFYLDGNTTTLVRHERTFEFKNYFGKTIGEPGPLELYESVELLPTNKTCCTKTFFVFAIARTDAHLENMKTEHPYCKSCITKKMTFCFGTSDAETFAGDHGLAFGQQSTVTETV